MKKIISICMMVALGTLGAKAGIEDRPAITVEPHPMLMDDLAIREGLERMAHVDTERQAASLTVDPFELPDMSELLHPEPEPVSSVVLRCALKGAVIGAVFGAFKGISQIKK